MTARFLVDGRGDQTCPLDDRGLRYGDGVFETMAVRAGVIAQFDRHLARLERGCAALSMAPPEPATLESDIAALQLPQLGVARLTVTRGSGGRGYVPPTPVTTRRIWEISDWPPIDASVYRDGIHLAWLDTMLAHQPRLGGIKHLNRLEQVLAACELATLEVDDGLLCDRSGSVIEAVSANLFVRKEALLITPALDHCGVAGIMRERVLECAESLGFSAVVEPLRRADVALADEVFITSSIRGVIPVRQLGAVRWSDFQAATALGEHLHANDGAPA